MAGASMRAMRHPAKYSPGGRAALRFAMWRLRVASPHAIGPPALPWSAALAQLELQCRERGHRAHALLPRPLCGTKVALRARAARRDTCPPEAHMLTKSDFTAEDWSVIRRAPFM